MAENVDLPRPYTVADLFSCGGGTSAGFAPKPIFRLVGAMDLQVAKPSAGVGISECNATYFANHGIEPLAEDIVSFSPDQFRRATKLGNDRLDVLISCAPCTDFTRTKPRNHLVDSAKNDLIARSADYVEALQPDILMMENARELINGRFSHHHERLCERLRRLGYSVRSEVHLLSSFGLPQNRERALIVASRLGEARTLPELWRGWAVNPAAVTVGSALARMNEWCDEHPAQSFGHEAPTLGPTVRARLKATPTNGGSWIDVARSPATRHLLTPVCRRRWEKGQIGSHPDVYGRMRLDRPAPTIKRECAHVGNGRYAHPVENRLLTVREMATLQGFPFDYKFVAKSITNRYRHIGDAVPPMIAWQMSCLAEWMKTGRRPEPEEWVMPRTSLRTTDLVRHS